MSQSLTPQALAAMIDHTFLKPFGGPEPIEKLCAEARQYGFAMVAINPAEVAACVRLLARSPVRVGAAIGFPLGQNTPEVKAFETRDAIARGAGEIDMVINIRALQSGDHALVRGEIESMAALCREAGVISKVILETCYLTDEEKVLVCQMSKAAGADFVKTSTGFSTCGDRCRLQTIVASSLPFSPMFVARGHTWLELQGLRPRPTKAYSCSPSRRSQGASLSRFSQLRPRRRSLVRKTG